MTFGSGDSVCGSTVSCVCVRTLVRLTFFLNCEGALLSLSECIDLLPSVSSVLALLRISPLATRASFSWSIQKEDTKVIASQRLASGSLAYITREDNGYGNPNVGGRYKHKVPPDPAQPMDTPRFSIVFRAIMDHPRGS